MSAYPGESTRASWDRIAPGYDRTNTPTQMWLGNEGLRRARLLGAGMRFLDVAAGSGALSIPAARIGAEVLATDQSPVMLELLAKRARAEGLKIETRVMDGEALDDTLPAEDRARRARVFADRAIQLLINYKSDPYLKSADTLKHLKTDKSFDSIRERAEFRELVGVGK